MAQTGVPTTMLEQNHLNCHISQANIPCPILVEGPREDYLKMGVPLYRASITCNWKVAQAILEKKPELVRYSITENMETPLHVAASAKGDSNVMEEFVKNLVALMRKEDLELENKNKSTALYSAVVAGNVKAVKIILEKNDILLTIPGDGGQMLPLYAAALYGNYDVVKYLYENSNELCDDHGWTDQNRGLLFEKCVQNDMFDVALMIIQKYPKLDRGNALRVLARKPKAFHETKSNILGNTIKSVLANAGLKVANENERSALLLLRFLWEDIAKMPKNEIDEILRGPPDSVKQDNKTISRWVVQAMQLQKLISHHAAKMNTNTLDIIKGPQDLMYKEDQAMLLRNLISESLVSMHDDTQKIIKGSPNSTKHDNKLVSNKRDQALELQQLIFRYIANMDDKMINIIKSTRKEDQATQLEKLIFEHTEKISKESHKIYTGLTHAYESHSSHVIFIAAKMGNTPFLVEIIRQYPDLIWKVNDNNETLFHIAVKHRHGSIYNLLYEIGAMKDMITPLRDPNDNNMLHLAGMLPKKRRLEEVPGVALHMQRELIWFQEIKNMIPPLYREQKNRDGLTPHELFTKEHKDLVTLSEKWMKGTANQCMVVAALIATIVFATAFTIPGGYDQITGTPLFHAEATFMVFVIADAISLFSSAASILMFLAILTSRYAEEDFMETLPNKLIHGLATLFLSITTMTLSFGVSFFTLYTRSLIWIPILICMFAVMPVLLYIGLQYDLFLDVINSTFRSRYLFKAHKHGLYYENPKM